MTDKTFIFIFLSIVLSACTKDNSPDLAQAPEVFELETKTTATIKGEPIIQEVVSNQVRRPIPNYVSPDLRLSQQLILHEPPQPKAKTGNTKYRYVGLQGNDIMLEQSTNRALQTTIEAANTQTNIDNTGGNLFIPADPHGAAGPNHVVNVANVSIEFYNKDGSGASSQSLLNFFSALNPANFTFDPKVLYDQFEERFVVVTLERVDDGTSANNSSALLVAVSDDSNPNGVWFTTRIDVTETIGTVESWLDYPGFSIDEEAVYITGNMFGFGSESSQGFQGNRLIIIDKGVSGGFYDNNTASVNILDPIPTGAFGLTMQPAHVFGLPSNGGLGTYLIGYSGLAGGTTDFFQVIQVNNPVTATPIITASFVAMGDADNISGALTNAPQSGTATLLSVNDRRTLNAVLRGNSLWTSTTMNPNAGNPDAGQTTAVWAELDVSLPSAIVLEDLGYIGGEDIAANTFTYFPAIAVNEDGGLVIGFSASSATTFAGAYFTTRSPSDSAGTTRESITIRDGLASYVRTFGGPRNRWGDYTSTVVDPDEACFWIYNKYAITQGTPTTGGETGRWGSAHAHFCNGAPTANTDAATVENGQTVTELNNGNTSLLTNDTDPDNSDTLSINVAPANNPSNGSVTLFANGTFSYTHNGTATTTDSFQYTVCDDGSPIECQIGTVNINITPSANTPPVANPQSVSVDEDDSLAITLTGSDADVGDNLTFSVNTSPSNGNLSGTAPNLTYSPNGNFNGSDSFTFTVNDGTVDSATATISITVNPVNDAPVANAQSVSLDEDESLAITLTGSDIDTGDSLTFSLETATLNGSLTGTAPNFVYNPDADFNGSDSFTFTVNDGTVDSATATISITVNPVNDVPNAVVDTYALAELQTNIISAEEGVLANDSDIENNPLTAVLVDDVSNGNLVFNTDGSFEYTPSARFPNTDSFTYRALDGKGESVITTVDIEITDVIFETNFD